MHKPTDDQNPTSSTRKEMHKVDDLKKLNLQTEYCFSLLPETHPCSDPATAQVKLAVDFLVSSRSVVQAVKSLIPKDWVNITIGPDSTMLDDVTCFLYEMFHIVEEYPEPSEWKERD